MRLRLSLVVVTLIGTGMTSPLYAGETSTTPFSADINASNTSSSSPMDAPTASNSSTTASTTNSDSTLTNNSTMSNSTIYTADSASTTNSSVGDTYRMMSGNDTIASNATTNDTARVVAHAANSSRPTPLAGSSTASPASSRGPTYLDINYNYPQEQAFGGGDPETLW